MFSFFKRLKPSSSSPSIYGKESQFTTRQKTIGAISLVIILLFLVSLFFTKSSSSPNIENNSTNNISLTEQHGLIADYNFTISIPEGFEQFQPEAKNSSKIFFRKQAEGISYDYINVGLASLKTDDSYLSGTEKSIKEYSEYSTRITQLDDGTEVLIVEGQADSNIGDQAINSETPNIYLVAYYIKKSEGIWQITVSSQNKDSEYIKSSVQIAKSLKLT